MPDNIPHWCNRRGNPIKYSMHCKLLRVINECSVRGEGAYPKAKRALTIVEIDKELEMLRVLGVQKEDYNYTVKYPAKAFWQYLLIGRIDDVVHLGMGSPLGHPSYNFAGKTKVQCLKNMKDEADCPPQILLGSGDRYTITYFDQSLKHSPSYYVFFTFSNNCILIMIYIFMESFLDTTLTQFFFTEDDNAKGPGRFKGKYSKALRDEV